MFYLLWYIHLTKDVHLRYGDQTHSSSTEETPINTRSDTSLTKSPLICLRNKGSEETFKTKSRKNMKMRILEVLHLIIAPLFLTRLLSQTDSSGSDEMGQFPTPRYAASLNHALPHFSSSSSPHLVDRLKIHHPASHSDNTLQDGSAEIPSGLTGET